MLAIAGCIITVDSMGCQVEVAQTIVAQEADYILALKENQPLLYADVECLFTDLDASPARSYRYVHAQSFDNNHGRAEKRQCWTIADPEVVQYLCCAERWPKLQCVVRVRREYVDGDAQKCEGRFFLSSLTGSAEQMLEGVRVHWHVVSKTSCIGYSILLFVCCLLSSVALPQYQSLLHRACLRTFAQ